MSGCGSTTCGCGSACKCGSSCQCKNTMDDAMLAIGGSSKGFEMDFGYENDCKCGANCKCADCQCHK